MINQTLAPIFVRFFATGLNFILVILLSNFFSAEDLGKYFIFFSTINLVSTFIAFGCNTFVLREFHLNEDIKNIAFNNVFINVILFMIIFASLIFLKIINFSSFNLSILFGSISLVLFKVFSDYFKAKKQPVLSQFIEFSILPIIIILCLVLFSLRIELTLFYSTIIYFFISFLFLVNVRPEFKLKFSDFYKVRSRFFNLFLVSLVNTSYGSFPYVIFPYFLSLEQIGIFGIAHKIISISGSIIMALSSTFNVSFSELFSQNKINTLNKTFKKSQLISFFYYVIFMSFVIIFKDYFSIVFGQNFDFAYPVLFWMMLIRLISNYFAMSEHILNMTQKEKYELFSSIISIIICLIFSSSYGFLVLNNSIVIFGIIYSSMFMLRSLISYLFYYKLIYNNG